MNRRDALLTTSSMVISASLGALACGAPAVAQNGAPPPPLPPPHAHGGSHEVHHAASECLEKGGACIAHCIGMIASGDTSMAACLKAANDMHAAMVGLAALAASGNPHLPAFAKAAAELCNDCERECRKHADAMVVCKECADACSRTAAACGKLAT